MIGVNLGTLGYLCELERESLYPAIDRIMRDEYSIEERMLIHGEKQNEPDAAFPALNDIVLHRSGKTQIIRLQVTVNGEFLYEYDADGIIVATPTGSTGYNISAGGPIVDPKAKMILITPINPHGLNSRSIVLGSDADILLRVAGRRTQGDEEVAVSYDGDSFGIIGVGDTIRVRRAKESARILKVENLSFLQILRKKMEVYR